MRRDDLDALLARLPDEEFVALTVRDLREILAETDRRSDDEIEKWMLAVDP